MDAPCRPTRPRTFPQCSAPTRRPTHSLADLAARFAVDAAATCRGPTLTGITLATADLRPGDVVRRREGRQPPWRRVLPPRPPRRARVAVVTDAAGADLAAASGLPVVLVDDPRAALGDLSAWVYSTGRDDHLPILFGTTGTNGKTSVSHLLEGILGQLGATTGLSSTRRAPHRRPDRASRLTTPEAYEMHALLALMRERGVEAVAVEVSAQALEPSPRGRHRVRRRRIHQPHARPPRRLRRHARVLRGEAAAVPPRPGTPRGRLRRLRARRRGRRAQRGADRHGRHARPARSDPDAAAAADWVVDILDERQVGTEFRLTARDGRTLDDARPA